MDTVLFNMDTNRMSSSIQKMEKSYPFLSQVLFEQMLELDSLRLEQGVKSFINAYRPIYKASEKINAPIVVQAELEKLFQRVKYYFPAYILPQKIIYFIGPLEGFSNTIGEDYMAIGLQLYLGQNSPWYQSEQIQKLYPTYTTRNFTISSISVNAAKNLLEDISPLPLPSGTLITEIVEAGKRQYLLKKLLPKNPEEQLYGYTKKQWESVLSEEEAFWNYLIKMNLIYSKDPEIVNNFLDQGPFSEYFGQEIPRNVGQFIGYKIVESWMNQQKNKNDLKSLLAKPAQLLFAQSNYHP